MLRIVLSLALILAAACPTHAQRARHNQPGPTVQGLENQIKGLQQQAVVNTAPQTTGPAWNQQTPTNVSWTTKQEQTLIAQQRQFMQMYWQMQQYFMAQMRMYQQPQQFRAMGQQGQPRQHQPQFGQGY